MGSVSQEGNVGNVNNRGAGDSIEVSPGYGFEVGDMVWGKVKSHPWWPGHVYSEELATPSVRRSKKDGLLLVAFFGDSSYGWFDSSELIPFDSNFSEKSLQTNSRTFVKALEEAIDEVRRRSALGLSCMCRNKQNFRKTDAQGFFADDVVDYEPGAVYSINTIGKARASFQPRLALDFVRELALEPTDEHDDIDFIKNKAIVMSYRRAVYEEFDEPYDQAFGGDLVRPLPGSIQVSTSGKKPSKAPLSGRQVFGDTANAKLNKPKDNAIAIAKTDKYLFKRRQQPKIHKVEQSTPADNDIEDPIIATLKLSTMEEDEDTNIVPPDFEINTPIISLIHNNSSNLQKKRKKDSLMEKVSANIEDQVPGKKKRKNESLIHDVDDGDSSQMELPRVLSDLHSFARDPFHTNNKKLRSKVRQVFLNFRSLVFQKSLNGPTHTKSPVTGAPPVKPPPPPGIKRDHHHHRHEETAAKKKKLKSSTNEDGGRRQAVGVKKSGQEVGQRAEEPTTLKMEFPSGGSLPSISELKAKLGRFGTMDHDGTRIYWKTFTCLVVYKYKADALAALKAVDGGSNLFGNADVKFSLKEVSDSEPPAKVSDHQPTVEDKAAAAAGLPLKSCLKNSGGEEGGGRKTSRVKFNLAGDKSRNRTAAMPPPPLPPLASPPPRNSMKYSTPSLPPQSMLVALPPPPPPPPLASPPPPRNSMKYSTPSAPPSLPPQSMLVAPPPPPPPPPLAPPPPPPLPVVPLQPVPRLNRPAAMPPPPPDIDIAQQMVSLLTRCNDVVAHVTGILGYVPYHPL